LVILSLIVLVFALRFRSLTVPPVVWWIALGGCFLALAILTVRVFPRYLVDRTIVSKKMPQPTTAEYLKAENDVRATLLQGLGALVLLLGAYTAWQQLLVAREGQVTDRFTHAIDQLGNDNSLDVRLGGIYALERIAKDSPRDYGPIMEVLTAFVREHAPWKGDQPPAPANGVPSPPPPGTQSPKPKPLTYIQAVMTVIGRRVIPQGWNGPSLDLSNTDLRGADLSVAHLEGAFLYKAHLEGAALYYAHLEGAFLGRAHLEGASLFGAYLDGTDFYEADLKGADLRDARNLNKALNLTKEQLATARTR
jgi:hypothetical protein